MTADGARSASELEAHRQALTLALDEPVTMDRLTGDWNIFQRQHGHRYSTDDLLTGWYGATRHAALGLPAPAHLLDLGTGIGSVGLTCLWLHKTATLTAVEAQAVSARLLRANIWANRVEDRVRAIEGDLRQVVPETLGHEGGRFDLITGSPPYFDKGKGIVPKDSQKAHARFELRGDVRDYCAAARLVLAANGLFVFCFPTVQLQRALAACAEHALAVITRRDVVPREGLKPLFTLFCCRHAEPNAPPCEVTPPLRVRGADGERTAEMEAVRGALGF